MIEFVFGSTIKFSEIPCEPLLFSVDIATGDESTMRLSSACSRAWIFACIVLKASGLGPLDIPFKGACAVTPRNVVYDFFFERSDKKKDRLHHIGQTSRPYKKRISEHLSGVNNPESTLGKTIPVYKLIRAAPDTVRIRSFNVDELRAKGIPLPLLETAFMQYFDERGEEVENKGSGGKGGGARS